MSVTRRARVMFKFRELVDRHTDELTRIISSEHGKVLDDAKGEVIRGMEVVEFACGIAQLTKGEYSDQVSTDIDALSFRQPLGRVRRDHAVQLPDHGPDVDAPDGDRHRQHVRAQALRARPVACPTSWPSSTRRPGLPDGVFNVVHGDKVAVDALLDHPDVAAVSFVGSTPIAKYVYERGTASGKRVQALGGAKNHAVVLPGRRPRLHRQPPDRRRLRVAPASAAWRSPSPSRWVTPPSR